MPQIIFFILPIVVGFLINDLSIAAIELVFTNCILLQLYPLLLPFIRGFKIAELFLEVHKIILKSKVIVPDNVLTVPFVHFYVDFQPIFL